MKKMPKFVGRAHELTLLTRFLKKKTASLIVIKGRRRIGKSRLIEEFAQPYQFYSFSFRPILIHVNGVQESVVESGYFAEMIDFSQALDGK